MRNHDDRTDTRTLAQLRADAGYTQEKAAHRFGVSVRTWGAWERREPTPRGDLADAPVAVWDLLRIEADEHQQRVARGEVRG
jgi:DNA-binding XRE family transcriptional regulator